MEPDVTHQDGLESERPSVSTRLEALGEFYRRYHAKLLGLARYHLRRQQVPDVEYSEEDAIQSSYRTLINDIIRGKVASMEGDDFLILVRSLIAEKVMAARDRMDALKRGGAGIKDGRVAAANAGLVTDASRRRRRGTVPQDLDLFHSGLPHDEVHTIFLDTFAALLKLLNSEQAAVARKRIQACTIAEIAAELAVSTRTVDRLLKEIRAIWIQSDILDRT